MSEQPILCSNCKKRFADHRGVIVWGPTYDGCDLPDEQRDGPPPAPYCCQHCYETSGWFEILVKTPDFFSLLYSPRVFVVGHGCKEQVLSGGFTKLLMQSAEDERHRPFLAGRNPNSPFAYSWSKTFGVMKRIGYFEPEGGGW